MTEQEDATTRPVEDLISRLTEALRPNGDHLDELRHVVEGFFAQLELVPRRELDAHVQALRQMEATVAELERRLEALETP